jgi:transcriptional regulator, GntR family
MPSESELALQLGVATVTLREALVVLRQRGLIETRRGRNGGSFVCAPVELPEALLLQRLRDMSGPDLRDLGDEQTAISGTRRAWPPSAARRSSRRASPSISKPSTRPARAWLGTAPMRVFISKWPPPPSHCA